MNSKITIFAIALMAAFSLVNCSNDDDGKQVNAGEGELDLPSLDPALVSQGQDLFCYETFGDETFWTGFLHMNEVIEAAVSPAISLSVGLKVDTTALPAEVVSTIENGLVYLNDPQTTLVLLQLNAVVGLQRQVS